MKLWKQASSKFWGTNARNAKTNSILTLIDDQSYDESESGSLHLETRRTKECVVDLVAHLNEKKSISHFYHASGEVVFKEAPMTSAGFVEEWHRLYKAFPNVSVSCTELKTIRPDCVTAIFQVEGTHTGEPYGFGPFPEIPVTGIHVKLDPE